MTIPGLHGSIPLRESQNCLVVFKSFRNFVEKSLNAKICCVQCDWGWEYQPLDPFLAKHGIEIRHPCPQVHTHNGRTERKHRHIIQLGLAMLAHANIPLSFWWNSFTIAIFIINTLPTLVLENLSPFQKMYNRVPDYKFLKVFGYSVYSHLYPYSHHKIKFRYAKCLFLGYSVVHKGYKFLHHSGRVYITRNAKFDEFDFPYTSLFLRWAIPHWWVNNNSITLLWTCP